MTHAEQALWGLVDANDYVCGDDVVSASECVKYIEQAADKRAALKWLLVDSHDAFCVPTSVISEFGKIVGVYLPKPKDTNLVIACLLEAWKDGDIPQWGQYTDGQAPRRQVARKTAKKTTPKARKPRISKATRHAMNAGNAHSGAYCKCPRCGCGGQERGTTCDRCSSWIA